MSKLSKIGLSVGVLVVGIICIFFAFYFSKKYNLLKPSQDNYVNTGHDNYVSDRTYFLSSLNTGGIESCENMNDTENKYACKMNFMANNLSYLTTGNCINHLSGNYLSRCLNMVYMGTYECDKISDISLRLNCEDFSWISKAQLKNSKTYCDKIISDNIKKDCQKMFTK